MQRTSYIQLLNPMSWYHHEFWVFDIHPCGSTKSHDWIWTKNVADVSGQSHHFHLLGHWHAFELLLWYPPPRDCGITAFRAMPAAWLQGRWRGMQGVRRAFSNFSPSLAWVYSKMHCTSQLLYIRILQLSSLLASGYIFLPGLVWMLWSSPLTSVGLLLKQRPLASWHHPTMSHAPVIRSTIALRFGDTMSSSLSSGRYLCLGFGMVGFS